MKTKIVKLLRFIKIYGFSRSINKSFGRIRPSWYKPLIIVNKKRYVSIVGCGQFAFSTISYFIRKNHGTIFLSCYDTNKENAQSLARFYNFKSISSTFDDLLKNPDLKLLYIASNHFSHCEYAIKAIEKNIEVYIEKPICVNYEQFIALHNVVNANKPTIYAGYNRPFSKTILMLNQHIKNTLKPLSINYFISGHLIPSGHWYRNPEEGTRVCGNIGHWIDLTMHLFIIRGVNPEYINIYISYSNIEEPDDNISITMTTDFNDIVTIMLSSRSEPFEGINETINIQCGNVIAKIDDFRKITIWEDEKIYKKIFFPKDVGHKNSVNQPWEKCQRNWHEIEQSTLLMLYIKEMVLQRKTYSSYSFKELWGTISKKIIQI